MISMVILDLLTWRNQNTCLQMQSAHKTQTYFLSFPSKHVFSFVLPAKLPRQKEIPPNKESNTSGY